MRRNLAFRKFVCRLQTLSIRLLCHTNFAIEKNFLLPKTSNSLSLSLSPTHLPSLKRLVLRANHKGPRILLMKQVKLGNSLERIQALANRTNPIWPWLLQWLCIRSWLCVKFASVQTHIFIHPFLNVIMARHIVLVVRVSLQAS